MNTEKLNTLGLVHSTESFGSVDGPGIRFVIFLQGCKMRCLYCHNPDTWHSNKGEWRTSGDLLEQALRYQKYWGSSGGITVSGGEPLLQIDFLLDLFQKAKEAGVHTALDTAGNPFSRQEPFFSKFKKLMRFTDLVLLDLKQIDEKKHKLLTGHSNKNILELAAYLSEIQKPVWIRHVLVPEITDCDADLDKLSAFIHTLHNVEKVEVLPYHSMGEYKWKELGLQYQLSGVAPPDQKRIQNAKRILKIES